MAQKKAEHSGSSHCLQQLLPLRHLLQEALPEAPPQPTPFEPKVLSCSTGLNLSHWDSWGVRAHLQCADKSISGQGGAWRWAEAAAGGMARLTLLALLLSLAGTLPKAQEAQGKRFPSTGPSGRVEDWEEPSTGWEQPQPMGGLGSRSLGCFSLFLTSYLSPFYN